MGNEQSTSQVPSTGVSSSFSFLRKKSVQKSASSIVVVNAAGQVLGDPKDDEDLKKLKEIPRFQPILKGVLPGQRDSNTVFNKVDAQCLARFTARLQKHFQICQSAVSSEQLILVGKISEADQKTSALLRRVALCAKKYDSLTHDLKRVEVLENSLVGLQKQLNDVLVGLQSLNDLLPESERLPPLPQLIPNKPCHDLNPIN